MIILFRALLMLLLMGELQASKAVEWEQYAWGATYKLNNGAYIERASNGIRYSFRKTYHVEDIQLMDVGELRSGEKIVFSTNSPIEGAVFSEDVVLNLEMDRNEFFRAVEKINSQVILKQENIDLNAFYSYFLRPLNKFLEWLKWDASKED